METATCTRCKRSRLTKRLKQFKNRKGVIVWRCRARSVCASKARRNAEKRARTRSAGEK